jgi:predicted porin
MKKITSALALAAVLAVPSIGHASNFNFSGYVSAGITDYSYSGDDALSEGETGLDDTRYSRFRFSGSEDLGASGFRGEFMIEQRVTLTEGALSGVGNGNMWVALSGDNIGKLYFGKIDTYYADGILTEISRGTSFQSLQTLSLMTWHTGYGGIVPIGRVNNQIRYDTPAFNGFSGTVAYSFQETNAATDDQSGSIYASGRYLAGPIYAGLSVFNNSETDVDAFRAYGSYTLPMGLKIGAMLDVTSFGDETRTAFSVPLVYTLDAHRIYASIGAVDYDEADDAGATMFTLGYDFGLTPRTSFGANVSQISNDDNGTEQFFLGGAVADFGQKSTPAGGTDIRQIYAGITHAF